jgi:hypothetical protein
MTITSRPTISAAGLTPAAAAGRLIWLHLASRRVPTAVAALASCAIVLRILLATHEIVPGGQGAAQVPAMIEGAAAAVIAVTGYSPFGESERVTGRWLPRLRVGTALGITAAAIGLLCAGVAGTELPGGDLAMIRNTAGAAGLGLLTASVLGGLLAWIGPLSYTVIAEIATSGKWNSPLTWPARAGHDRGAAICAVAVFAAGLLITRLRGARD